MMNDKIRLCGCTFSQDNPARCLKCGGVLGTSNDYKMPEMENMKDGVDNFISKYTKASTEPTMQPLNEDTINKFETLMGYLEHYANKWPDSVNEIVLGCVEEMKDYLADNPKFHAPVRVPSIPTVEEIKAIRAETKCPNCGCKKLYIGITEAQAIITHLKTQAHGIKLPERKEELRNLHKKFVEKMLPLDSRIVKIVDENFWNLILSDVETLNGRVE